MTVKPGEALAVLVPDSGALEPFELEAIASRLERRMVEQFDFVGRAKIVTHRNGHGAKHVASADDVILISQDAVRNEREWIGRGNREGYLFVVDQAFARSGEVPELPPCASVVVMNDRKILGGGDLEWFRVHAAHINDTLKSLARPAEEREDFDDDDDALDE